MTSRSNTLVILAVLACASCDLSSELNMSAERPWYHVAGSDGEAAGGSSEGRGNDPFGAPPGYVAGSRSHEQAAAIEEFLALYPATARGEMRKLVTSESGAIVSASDANAARLLRTIYEIRRHDEAAMWRDRSRQRAREHSTVVGIALREHVSLDSPAVVVYRRRAKYPANVIVLSGQASAEHLVAGLVALTRSRQQHGDELPMDQTIRITAVPESVADRYRALLARAERTLPELRAKPLTTTDGFGQARTTTIRIPPVNVDR